jgi:hypothetical protein
MKLVYLLLLASCLITPCYSQESHNIRNSRPLGFSFSLGKETLITGLSVDLFVTPSVNLEIGLGYGQYIGVRYHILGANDNIKWSPYLGASVVTYSSLEILPSPDDRMWGGYIPLGVHFISSSGIAFSLEAGLLAVVGTVNPWGGIQVGFHF